MMFGGCCLWFSLFTSRRVQGETWQYIVIFIAIQVTLLNINPTDSSSSIATTIRDNRVSTKYIKINVSMY